MVKLSTFVVSMVVLSVLMTYTGLMIYDIGDVTGRSTGKFNVSGYNYLKNMSNIADDVNSDSENIKQDEGWTDIIGGYVGDAYKVLKSIPAVYKSFDSMTEQSMKDANLISETSVLRRGITTIVLILVVIGGLITALLRWNV